MKWSEGVIAGLIARDTLAKKCLVLVDRCNWTGYECDVLGVTMDLRIVDVEIKISRGDFKADMRKDKWWHRMPRWSGEHGPDQRLQWPRKVWKHYFAMPAEIWTSELTAFLPSPASGVLLVEDHRGNLVVRCERRATPAKDAERLKPEHVIDIARLANLRMWDAYRDAKKLERAST